MVTTVPTIRLAGHDDEVGARLLLTIAALVEATWCGALVASGLWLIGL
jgi:hypothetical protein